MKNRKTLGLFFTILIFVISILLAVFLFGNTNKSVIDVRKLNLNNIFYIHSQEEKIDLKHPYLTLDIIDEGYDIYVPNGSGYRYGPSIIYYEDGSMDAWFASNGNNTTEWDYITYRHYDGEGWSKEKIVLKPTKKSKDHYSTCDPGAIYFDGYYYIGYTSTENSSNGGVENSLYVARSKKPNGPYEKWNGSGWGNKPQPIISYDENDGQWGIGEVSFVLMEDKIYCYYSYINGASYTKLAIGDICENWPETLIDQGIVIEKTNNQDSCDVVYCDDYKMFIALCVESRFLANSSVAVYTSNDGINFSLVDNVNTNMKKYIHNLGISKKADGHIGGNDDLLLGYAYSNTPKNFWGKWSTRFHNVKLVTKFK